MNVNFAFVDGDHYLYQWQDGRYTWRRTSKVPPGRALYALDDDERIVGLVHYCVMNQVYRSIFTFVEKVWRREGLASALWDVALAREDPEKVIVNVISDKGWTLVSSLVERYPGIEWCVDDDGDRKLRDKRKAA